MSCNFCNNFNFNTIAIKNCQVHIAGGNSSFEEHKEFAMFQFCPLCGGKITQLKQSQQKQEDCVPKENETMNEAEYNTVCELCAEAGCSWEIGKQVFLNNQNTNITFSEMVSLCKKQ